MPTLTTRKLIKFGDNGIVITVSTGWARYYGLKAGDILEVIADEELIVRPERKSRITNSKRK